MNWSIILQLVNYFAISYNKTYLSICRILNPIHCCKPSLENLLFSVTYQAIFKNLHTKFSFIFNVIFQFKHIFIKKTMIWHKFISTQSWMMTWWQFTWISSIFTHAIMKKWICKWCKILKQFSFILYPNHIFKCITEATRNSIYYTDKRKIGTETNRKTNKEVCYRVK